MTKYYLHFGLNKTGTSAIQETLYLNKDFLKTIGIHYPVIGDFGLLAHHSLAKCINEEEVDRLLNEDQTIFSGVWDKVIFSSELFYRMSPHAMRHFLKRLGKNTNIIIYCRPVLEYFLSWYQFEVSYSNKFMRFGDFCSQITSYSLGPSNFLCNVNSFSKETEANLNYYLYDKNNFPQGNIWYDFIEKIELDNIDQLNKNISVKENYSHNKSLGGELFNYKILLNFFLSEEEANESIGDLEIISYADKSFRGKLDLNSDELNWVFHHFLRDEAIKLSGLSGLELTKEIFHQHSGPSCISSKIELIANTIDEKNLKSPFSKKFLSLFKRNNNISY